MAECLATWEYEPSEDELRSELAGPSIQAPRIASDNVTLRNDGSDVGYEIEIHFHDQSNQEVHFNYLVSRYRTKLNFEGGGFVAAGLETTQAEEIEQNLNAVQYSGSQTFSKSQDGRVYLPHPSGFGVVSLTNSRGKPIPLYRTELGEYFARINIDNPTELRWGIAPETFQPTVVPFDDQLEINWSTIDPKISEFISEISQATDKKTSVQSLLNYIKARRDYELDALEGTEGMSQQALFAQYYEHSTCAFSAMVTADVLIAQGLT